jgi:PAS domain S-box-containing protein
MIRPRTGRLSTFARQLLQAATFEEMVAAAQAELKAAIGYPHAWLFISDNDDVTRWRLVAPAGVRRAASELAPALQTQGDAMLEQIAHREKTVVIVDARTDRRTDKEIVAQIGHRTIISVPLRLLGKPFGAFGTGTFGDEGCRRPTPDQFDYLEAIAGKLSVAAGRLRFLGAFRRTEEALRASEEDLRITLRSIGDAVIATDALGQITRMNPVAEHLTGWTAAEAKGHKLNEVFQILNEDTRGSVENPVDRVLRDGVVVGLANHTVLVSRDGTERAIADTGAPIRDDQGTIRGVVLVFNDQTEQRNAARGVRRSAVRLQVLAETSHRFAEVTHVDTLLHVIAKRLSEVIGEICVIRLISKDREWMDAARAAYHPDPVTLAEASKILFSVPRRVGEGIVGRVAATGEPLLVPVIVPGVPVPESSPRYQTVIDRLGVTSMVSVPVKARGRVIGVITMSRSTPNNPYTVDDQHLAQDIADRAGLAIDNAQLLLDLEERVEQRTSALVEANRELETFSYSVSHDLRAPLRSIDGFSQALLADHAETLAPDAQDYLRRIHGAAQCMAGLIDDLLRLSRVSQIEFRRERVSLSAIATSVIADLQRGDPQRQVQVTVQSHVVAVVDPRLVRITLENLLGNAWKFTSKTAAPTIEFGAFELAGEVVYFVRDNGAGFDMKFVDRVFRPFQRLHADSEFPGTGIGLATVHRITQRHHGRIWVEAAVDRGAAFYFTLPPE